jgi:hypothetical protein
MSYFIIGGTNVAVGQMSGGTNVGGTCVSGTKVAPPSMLHILHCRSPSFQTIVNIQHNKRKTQLKMSSNISLVLLKNWQFFFTFLANSGLLFGCILHFYFTIFQFL